MKKNIERLKSEFERIKAKGYIRGICNNYSAIGRTFENELNLPENSFSVPDYYGIEIKTRRAYSKSCITLFNATPDGEGLFEIKRLKNTYGYPSRKNRKYKVIYIEAYGNKLNFGGIKYKYKLDVSRSERKVFLSVYDRYDRFIERKVYWSFDYLEERLNNKLKYLAVINTWTNTKDGWNYFKYYKMDIYKYTNFESFINLIENGTIKLHIKVDIYTNPKHYGKSYDHGCGFVIEECNLSKLFDLVT